VKIVGDATTQTKISVNALGADTLHIQGDLFSQLNKSGTITPDIAQAIPCNMAVDQLRNRDPDAA
jgi:hypothetical protein